MSLSEDDPRSPYQQIADDLREQILSGTLKPGRKLPSTRELMERYEVANQTVQSAMRILRSEELVHSVAGRGTYVREELPAAQETVDQSSPAYKQIMSRLDSIVAGMEKIDERLTELEAAKAPSRAQKAAKPRTRSK